MRDDTQYHADVAASIATGKSIEQVRAERRASERAREVSDPEGDEIQREEARVAKEVALVEARKAARVARIQQGDSMRTRVGTLADELQLGRDQFASLDNEAGRVEFIHAQIGNPHAQFTNPTALMQLGSMLAGTRAILEQFPIWIAAKEKELADAKEQLAAFDKEHGTDLTPKPPEPQPEPVDFSPKKYNL